jgi:hypothetical protein
MNRRVCVCIGLFVWCGLLTGGALAQTTTAGPTIPMSAKNATDATTSRATIAQFIQSQIISLLSDDPAIQKTARDRLIAECPAGSSGSYFDVYGHELNAAVMAAMNRNPLPPLRVRLNMAVVVETVARVGQTTQVRDAVIAMMNDPSDAVALWGMKAAAQVLPQVLQNPVLLANDKLLPAFLSSVKLHPGAGFVASEAYRALSLANVAGINPNQVQQLIPHVIKPMLDVLEFRVSLYQSGIPDNAEAEKTVATFFNSTNYNAAGPADQHRIIQDMVNLITLAGEQSLNANKPQLAEIIDVLKYAAQELIVVSQNPAVTNALVSLTQLAPGSSPQSIEQKTKTVYGALQTVFQYLQQPPTITNTTNPATTAATTR